MIEVADIVRLHGQAFRQAHPGLLPFQEKVLRDIEQCRTACLGGHLQQCDRCGFEHYSYHSCRNRHCPKCHGEQTQRWLDQQRKRLVPCDYYLLTFTLPEPLRALARAQPRKVYGLLMNCAAASLQKLAHDPKWIGGKLAILAVLHTWTRAMLYHPHVHLLVPAGGLTKEGNWIPAKNPAFLVPCFALSKIFRAKFKYALKRLGYLDQIPASAWRSDWVVHCRHAGSGEKVLDYLGRYVFRIAIANSRLEQFQNGQVTFRYRDNRTQQIQHVTLPAQNFIDRFMQHILPKGFVKVRSYGFWSANGQAQLQKAKEQLTQAAEDSQAPNQPIPNPSFTPALTICPKCKCGHMILIEQILPQRKWPP